MIFGCLSRANLSLLSTSAGSVERVSTLKWLRISFDLSLAWSVHVSNYRCQSQQTTILSETAQDSGVPSIFTSQ